MKLAQHAVGELARQSGAGAQVLGKARVEGGGEVQGAPEAVAPRRDADDPCVELWMAWGEEPSNTRANRPCGNRARGLSG
jgi:hypothetical protein